MKNMIVRYAPKGSIVIHAKSGAAVAYAYTNKETGRICAIGYRGKSSHQAFNFAYRDDQQRANHLARFFDDADRVEIERARRKQERSEKLAKPHSLEVGDVLYSMWGYEQTNVDYYQVTAVIGKRTIEIRQIGCISRDTGDMQGISVPAVGHFVGDPMRKRVSEYNDVTLTSYSSASKLPYQEVAGMRVYEPKNWTAYA